MFSETSILSMLYPNATPAFQTAPPTVELVPELQDEIENAALERRFIRDHA